MHQSKPHRKWLILNLRMFLFDGLFLITSKDQEGDYTIHNTHTQYNTQKNTHASNIKNTYKQQFHKQRQDENDKKSSKS